MDDAPPPLARVIDFETIGVKPDDSAIGICEVGYCDLWMDAGGRPVVGEPQSALCNPGMAIPVPAMAVHHITDDMVAGQPPAESILREAMAAAVPKAAHNAAFERSFCKTPEGDHQWICTWKCAHRLWPHAPGFGNHALRYWLGLKLDPELWVPVHRAGPDAYVTAHVLAAMLRDGATIAELIEWSSQPVLLVTCELGKERGKRWDEVPEGFLRWLVNKEQETPGNFDEDVVHTARHYLRIATSGETP